MADDSQFVPDDMDFPDDVDPDAYLEMEQEWDAEMRDHENNMHMAGQGNPRKLDFAAFGDRSATFSDPMQPPLSQAGTAAVSSQLQLRLDTASQLPTLSNFEREQREEAEQQQKQQQFQQRGQSAVALPPQQTASRLFPSPAVLPLLRSVSELRQRVLDDERMYVYRRAPVLGEFMPVTTVKGDRVFLTMSTQDEAAKKVSHNGRCCFGRMLTTLSVDGLPSDCCSFTPLLCVTALGLPRRSSCPPTVICSARRRCSATLAR